MPAVSVGQEDNIDIEINYEVHGSGQPGVLIDGYPLTTSWCWPGRFPAPYASRLLPFSGVAHVGYLPGGRPDPAQRSAGGVGARSGPGCFRAIHPQAIIGAALETIEGYRPPPEVGEDYLEPTSTPA